MVITTSIIFSKKKIGFHFVGIIIVIHSQAKVGSSNNSTYQLDHMHLFQGDMAFVGPARANMRLVMP